LLEVLIALAVLALALFALSRTASNAVSTFAGLRERVLADWIASNLITETRLREPLPDPGKRDGQLKFAGRDWRWEMVIQATEEPLIRRFDVRVFTWSNRNDALVQVTGFSGKDLQP
jgi:general secretion pathway protein I